MINALHVELQERQLDTKSKKKKPKEITLSYDIEPEEAKQDVVNIKREIRKAMDRQEYPQFILAQAVKLRYVVRSLFSW